jgi:zinc protease
MVPVNLGDIRRSMLSIIDSTRQKRTRAIYQYRSAILIIFTILLLGLLPIMAYQETPPSPAPPRSVKIPIPVEKILKNGLRVIVVERPGISLVSAQVIIKSGAEIDPSGLDGLADITAALLTEGTTTRTAPQLAEQIDALGAELETDGSWDASTVSINVMASKFNQAMELLADVVQRPAFKDEEIERIRKQTIDDLEVELSQPGTLARYVAARVIYGDSPYGHALTGIPDTIKRIKRADIVRTHKTYYRPDNAILVIGGDIKAEEAFKRAEELLGTWKRPSTPLPKPVKSEHTSSVIKPRVVVIDKEDAGQAAVMLARLGIERKSKDFYSGIVANSVLGGGYSARLNQEIRIKRGLSYGAGSRLDARQHVGPFVASTQTKNESGAEVATLFLNELNRLGTEPIKEEELIPRKAVLTGGFSRSLETIEDLVEQVGSLALFGIPLDEMNKFINNVQSVSSEDIQNFVKARLDPKSSHIIIVGDAKRFIEHLKREFPNVEIIKESELDLGNSSLRRNKRKI